MEEGRPAVGKKRYGCNFGLLGLLYVEKICNGGLFNSKTGLGFVELCISDAWGHSLGMGTPRLLS